MPADIDASEKNNQSHGGIVGKQRRLRQLTVGNAVAAEKVLPGLHGSAARVFNPWAKCYLLRMRKLAVIVLLCGFVAAAQEMKSKPSAAVPDLAQLNAMAERFAPTPLRVDLSRLSTGDRKALEKLVEAAKIVNHIFMQQFWSGDLATYHALQQDKTPLGSARLDYF